MVEEHYNYTVLPSKWAECKPNTLFLEPPAIDRWEYPEGRAPEIYDEGYGETYMIICLAMNRPEELKVLKEHIHELVHIACEALGLPSEDLKWYRTVFIKRPAVVYRNLSPHALSDLFPQTRNIDDTPPVLNSIVQGHHAPFYELGWVIPFRKVVELLGELPEGEMLDYYTYKLLPRKWAKRKKNTTFLEPPEMEYWEYPEGRTPEGHDKDHDEGFKEAYVIIFLAINSSEELDVVKEHREELVCGACEVLGLHSEELKWYLLN
ncbi:hypothetical protein F5890DRAFT_1538350 [Lentinula detonsa]|uniref:Uncharacterized protein n=1 Tax=Lentinula detonsa TaxID=2804962 RepID=A0AA38PSP4_9AGAR|nr:hypothetical protein F5890DRAFT_1538350 [Lentinula detonsa]